MASEITTIQATGSTLYAILSNSVGQIYNTNSQSFEAPTSANWHFYSISLTDANTIGVYSGNMPTALNYPTRFGVAVFKQASGTAVPTDGPPVGAGNLDWDGAREVIAFGHMEGLEDAVTDISPGTSSFKGSTALGSVDGTYANAYLQFLSGTNKGIAHRISAYVGSTRLITLVNAFPSAPANGDKFLIVGRAE